MNIISKKPWNQADPASDGAPFFFAGPTVDINSAEKETINYQRFKSY